MSDDRVDIDDDHVFRILAGFGPDEEPALLLAGNKAGDDSWYDENVPVATNGSTPTSERWQGRRRRIHD